MYSNTASSELGHIIIQHIALIVSKATDCCRYGAKCKNIWQYF